MENDPAVYRGKVAGISDSTIIMGVETRFGMQKRELPFVGRVRTSSMGVESWSSVHVYPNFHAPHSAQNALSTLHLLSSPSVWP